MCPASCGITESFLAYAHDIHRLARDGNHEAHQEDHDRARQATASLAFFPDWILRPAALVWRGFLFCDGCDSSEGS